MAVHLGLPILFSVGNNDKIKKCNLPTLFKPVVQKTEEISSQRYHSIIKCEEGSTSPIKKRRRWKSIITISASEDDSEKEWSDSDEQDDLDKTPYDLSFPGDDTDSDTPSIVSISGSQSEEDEDEDTTVINKEHILDLESEEFAIDAEHINYKPKGKQPYWAYLMCAPTNTHQNRQGWNQTNRKRKRAHKGTGNWQTHVGKSRNPIRKVYNHNRGTLDSKSTRAGAPNWTIVTYIGPFESKDDSFQFLEMWRRKRRGLRRRLEYILEQQFYPDILERKLPSGLTIRTNKRLLEEFQWQ